MRVRVRVSINKYIEREIRKELQRIIPAYYCFTYPRYHINTNNPNITTKDMLYLARKTKQKGSQDQIRNRTRIFR
jgi:hypothetical protein